MEGPVLGPVFFGEWYDGDALAFSMAVAATDDAADVTGDVGVETAVAAAAAAVGDDDEDRAGGMGGMRRKIRGQALLFGAAGGH